MSRVPAWPEPRTLQWRMDVEFESYKGKNVRVPVMPGEFVHPESTVVLIDAYGRQSVHPLLQGGHEFCVAAPADKCIPEQPTDEQRRQAAFQRQADVYQQLFDQILKKDLRHRPTSFGFEPGTGY